MAFDGTNDKTTHGDIAGLDGATALTVAFWIKQVSWTSTDGIMDKGGSTVFRIIQFDTTSQIDFQGGASGAQARTNAGDFPTGEWHHYGVVFNGAGVGNAGRIQLYKNGAAITPVFVGTWDAALGDGGVTPLTFGADVVSSVTFGNIELAAVKVWTAALTAAEVASEAHIIRPSRTANLVLWAPYDDGTSAKDYSGAGNHGTVTEAVQAPGPPISYGAPVMVFG